jgi:DNA-binding GntR family transcriptional regulator
LEHQQILEALRERDGEEAARLMAQHIQAFQEEIQAVMVRG